MARAGAFSANFDPVVLDDFRSFCSGRGEKYTKVLEQLAIAYLKTEGELLAAQSVPAAPAAPAATRPSRTTAASSAPDQDLVRRLSRLEENDEFNAETFETIFMRLEEAEKVLKLGKYKK